MEDRYILMVFQDRNADFAFELFKRSMGRTYRLWEAAIEDQAEAGFTWRHLVRETIENDCDAPWPWGFCDIDGELLYDPDWPEPWEVEDPENLFDWYLIGSTDDWDSPHGINDASQTNDEFLKFMLAAGVARADAMGRVEYAKPVGKLLAEF